MAEPTPRAARRTPADIAGSPIVIHAVGGNPTVLFAAEELRAYVERMSGGKAAVRREGAGPRSLGQRAVPCAAARPLPGAAPRGAHELWVGTADAFPGREPPPVPDPFWDDAVRVSVRAGDGIVTGSNPRSVLLAAYRLLHEAGCRWVRPGADGEYVPRRAWDDVNVETAEAASYRHRGIVIEGAVSGEHVRDVVDWLPKVGMNSYFTQFRDAYCFFDRWYSHADNPFKAPEGFTAEKARELITEVAAEVMKRGLLYHAVGHGWTCEPLGIPGRGWEYPAVPAPPEAVPYLAQVAGKRAVWQGVPLNTNLCYSNPAVRRLMAEDIARYAGAHPEVDALHVWLADGSNNTCECDACRAARPSDFYVMILNEADALLTERGLRVKLVFLLYVDLLWPPERERLRNPDRFLLMFAPITRTYSQSFAPKPAPAGPRALPPFALNRLSFPREVGENLAFLDAWRALFPGDGFDFDYHYMWDHLKDPGYTSIARVLHEDVKLLKAMGLNGYLSCQVNRAFLPTGLGETVMGWTLWDASRDYETMRRDYYAAAFGADGELAAAYLEELTRRFDPPWMRGEKPAVDPAAAEALEGVAGVIRGFRPVMTRNAGLADPCHAASWRYLGRHADITEALAGVMAFRARGRTTEMRAAWDALRKDVWLREDELHHVMDAWIFAKVFGGMVGV